MFRNPNLSVIAYANGFTLWHYTTKDEIDVVEKDGYFNNVSTLCATGDIILLNAADQNGNPVSCIRSMVLDNGNVKLTNLK